MQRYKHAFVSPLPKLRTQRISHIRSLEPEKMYDAVVQQIAHRVVRQALSAHMHHSDVHGQSGYDARIARPAGDEPNVEPFFVGCGRR